MKVLVADDEDSNKLLLGRMLEKFSHDVTTCSDGLEVMGILFKGELPQLIFLDWMMPNLNGVEVCAKIRERKELPYTHVILATSRNRPEDVIDGLRAGANDYITKPLRPEEVEARLVAATRMIELNNLVAQQRLRLIANSRMALLGEMASGIAHEINNPLAIIQSNLDRLHHLLKPTLQAKDLSTLDNAYKASSSAIQRVASHISALKAFASEKNDEPVTTIPTKEIIETVLKFCAVKIKNHGIRLDTPCIPANSEISAQKHQISQVILSLIENSILATQDLRDKWIHIEFFEDEKHIMISVTDSGSGISEELRVKIMQPFFTTRGIGKGTGLGLSMALGIARSHNGDLTLDTSCLNTRFVLTLPKKL